MILIVMMLTRGVRGLVQGMPSQMTPTTPGIRVCGGMSEQELYGVQQPNLPTAVAQALPEATATVVVPTAYAAPVGEPSAPHAKVQLNSGRPRDTEDVHVCTEHL